MVDRATHDNAKAAALRALHVPGQPLVAPNAWDAVSAEIIERAGFSAVATSSAAVSASLGWADGEAAPVEEMAAAAAAIARSVSVPVTVDFERGYGLAPQDLVERFAQTGAVGLNLEDSDPATGSLVDVDVQVTFLRNVRSAAEAADVDLVVNARTDSFLRQVGSPEERLAASIARGNRYLEAGADCVYPLGTGDPHTIAALVNGIDGPVNVAFGVTSPLNLDEIAGLGVARVTFGPGLQRTVYSWFEQVCLPGLFGVPDADGTV